MILPQWMCKDLQAVLRDQVARLIPLLVLVSGPDFLSYLGRGTWFDLDKVVPSHAVGSISTPQWFGSRSNHFILRQSFHHQSFRLVSGAGVISTVSVEGKPFI